jgi:hypothetical protein
LHLVGYILDIHCFSVDEEEVKRGGNKSGELKVVLLPEHWTRWTSIYSITQASYKYLPFLNNQDLSSGRKWNVPQQATQIECLLPHSCLDKVVKS